MSQLEASNKYAQALKAGQKTYRECVLKGRYPYLQILDEILSDSMVAGQVDLGVIDIPADQIVGTKTVGRRTAFAADFMPLLAPDTEFASKWVNLCAAHLSEEGIRDPIRCYEYMGRFYVQEGNKRVSVLKSFDAPSIPGYVTRVIPAYSQDQAVQVYYEFLRSYPLTGLYQVSFSQLGGFAKLQAALGFDPDHVWTEEERRRFLAGFYYFKEAFIKLGGRDLHLTPADALLVWLQVYPIESVRKLPLTDIGKNLAAMWSDVKAAAQAERIRDEEDVFHLLDTVKKYGAIADEMFDGWGIPGRYLVFGEKKDLEGLRERELTKLSDILAEHDAENMSKALEQASWNLPYIIHGSSFRLLVGSIFELLARYCSLKRRIQEVRTEKDFLRLQKQTAKEGDTVPRLCRSWGVPKGEEVTAHDVLERAIRNKHLVPVREADLVLVCVEDGSDDAEGSADLEDMDVPDDFDDLDDPGEGWDE